MKASGTVPPAIGAAIVASVPVDAVTFDSTLEIIDGFVRIGRASTRTFQIVTVNVDFVVKAQHDPEALRILQRAELCLPDGMPILWHARLSGTPLRERVTGADLVPALVARSMSSGHRVMLFGSAEGVAEQAAEVLALRHPDAMVRGISGPFMSDVRQMDPRYIDEIKAFDPDILCVALGNPKQEKWIEAHRKQLGVPVLIGVGGTLDFLVGGRRRAPLWMQRAGLEWVYRAAQEPGRLGRRYAHDARIFGPHLVRAWRTRFTMAKSSADTMVLPPPTDNGHTIDLRGAETLDHRDIAGLVGRGRDSLRAGERLVLTGVRTEIGRRLGKIGGENVMDIRPYGA
jgi:N-acetylglucosaminyldiphosphoundecaprenol N-acetyl-beta-D-mannosaminyltransferase